MPRRASDAPPQRTAPDAASAEPTGDPPAQQTASDATPPGVPSATRRPSELWRAAVDAVRATSPRHGTSLAFGRLVRVVPGEVVIAFPPEADFHRSTVSGAGRATIEQVLTSTFGRPTTLVIDSAAASLAPHSIAEVEAKERAAHERTVEARVRNHPALQSALRILGGEVEHVQVLERERPTVADPEPVDDPS
jgi:hypothetical protein